MLINHLWMDVVLLGATTGSWDCMGHWVRCRTPYGANKRLRLGRSLDAVVFLLHNFTFAVILLHNFTFVVKHRQRKTGTWVLSVI